MGATTNSKTKMTRIPNHFFIALAAVTLDFALGGSSGADALTGAAGALAVSTGAAAEGGGTVSAVAAGTAVDLGLDQK